MEDSYTVHRRRKAAAKRREKTPDPSARNHQLVETSDDEEEARRARMERMAEDAERAEQEEREKKTKQEDQQVKERKKSPVNVMDIPSPRKLSRERKSPVKLEVEARDSKKVNEGGKSSPTLTETQTCDVDYGESVLARSVRKESITKLDNGSPVEEVAKTGEVLSMEKYREIIPTSKDVDADVDQPVQPRKVERRLKKKSRERVERQERSSDSSDIEGVERRQRRTKSPEGSRVRTKRTSSRKVVSGEVDNVMRDVVEKPPREKKSGKQRAEESEDHAKRERVDSRRTSQTDDTEEERKMRKSESFPRQSSEDVEIKRSSSDIKKQIIPLSNDSLIEDFAKAQQEYLKRERGILDPDAADAFEDAQEETTLRRRKFSMPLTQSEEEAVEESIEKSKEIVEKKSWLSWLSFFQKNKEESQTVKPSESTKKTDDKLEEIFPDKLEKVTFMDFVRAMKDVVSEFKAFVVQNPKEADVLRKMRNHCLSELLLIVIYCGLGAFIFRFIEGTFETFYKCGVKRVKRDFLDNLWNYSHNLREDDWKSMARRKLMEFEEQLHTAHEAGVHTYSGQKSWTFLNAVVYCLTVITTIGYGHISPSTNTGRAITIVYAIFGIPMFLIILADFGKLFTRGIKFLWAFVRRVYYTGSCKKVRRTVPVQEVMKGVQLVYDLATFKRPSQINPEDIEEMQKQAQQSQTVLNLDGNVPDTPGTPAMSAFAIDDEFNLPISVAIFILLGYIFIGATLFCLSEGWGFFESFYFVFISMSTIGFGDYVPKHPIYMMCSIIYLVFGLALTSMCINVVQVMLSDSFRQASQKIGATIGFAISEEDRSVNPTVPPPVEIADVHSSLKNSDSDEKIAPKAKQEDVDL